MKPWPLTAAASANRAMAFIFVYDYEPGDATYKVNQSRYYSKLETTIWYTFFLIQRISFAFKEERPVNILQLKKLFTLRHTCNMIPIVANNL